MNDNFCIIPWVSLYRFIDGNIYPCPVMSSYTDMILTSGYTPLSAAWFSEKLNKFKQDMLDGKRNIICDTRCNKHVNSCKKYFGTSLLNEALSSVALFKKDNPFKLRAVNIIESNKCNFKCLYCNESYSNLHSKDRTIKKSYEFDLFKVEFIEQIENLKEIWFASGESVIQDSYYWILDTLIKHNKQNSIKLFFITNLSKKEYKQRDVFAILNKFESVKVFGSLDGDNKINSLLRVNSNFNDIINNIKHIKQYKNITFYLQPVLSNLNILQFPDFHKQMVEEGILRIDNIRYYVLNSPSHFRIDVLPVKYKQRVIKRYTDYIEWLKGNSISDEYPNNESPIKKLLHIIDVIKKEPKNKHLFFANLYNKVLCNLNITDYPEFLDIYNEAKLHALRHG